MRRHKWRRRCPKVANISKFWQPRNQHYYTKCRQMQFEQEAEKALTKENFCCFILWRDSSGIACFPWRHFDHAQGILSVIMLWLSMKLCALCVVHHGRGKVALHVSWPSMHMVTIVYIMHDIITRCWDPCDLSKHWPAPRTWSACAGLYRHIASLLNSFKSLKWCQVKGFWGQAWIFSWWM